MPRRFQSQRPPTPPAPPASAAEGAARVRALLIKEFDRRDGTGVDWLLMLESLFRAGFQIADSRPDDDARRSIMRRVHEGSYARITGDAGSGKTETAEPTPAPLNSAAPKAQRPRPPR